MKKWNKIFLRILFLLLPPLFLHADGFIVIPHPPVWPVPGPLPRPVPPARSPFPLEVKYHHVSVRIKDQTATTRIEQAFLNPTDQHLEGLYLFPLPEGASIRNFSLEVDGKMVSAELLEADKAREIYQDIVRRLKDPALLEYAGQQTFKMRIFPIEPGKEKRITVSYIETLRSEANLITYRYPLNTEKFSARPIDQVSLKIELQTSQKTKTIFSPSHQVEIKRKNDYQATVGFEARQIKPDKDLILSFGLENDLIGLNLLTHRMPGEDGFFLLTASPGLEADQKNVLPKDIIFVVDTSGSMAGKKLEQLKKALIFCLDNLNDDDRFNIIRFSTEVETIWPVLQVASQSNITKAKQMVEEFKAIGGTNLEGALLQACQQQQENQRPCIIIFLTDGRPTIGETQPGKILEKLKQTNTQNLRIFTFGIGHDVNTYLLDRITELTRAERVYVYPEEDLEIKISAFYEKVKSPVLTDIQINFEPVKVFSVHPVQLPDLFRGCQLLVLGRFQGQGKAVVTLSGRVEKGRREFKKEFVFPEENKDNDFLPVLWAAQRIGYLLDQIRLHGEEKELKEEVVSLARKYGIVTPYTSYLIVEDEKTKMEARTITREEAVMATQPGIDKNLERKMIDAYQSLNQATGSGSVRASREVQTLKKATSFADVFQGKEQLAYVDNEGKTKNLVQQVKYVQGRAFYLVDDTWVDPFLQSVKNIPTRKIKFASAEYFQLMEKKPEIISYLALGKSMRFVFQNEIYFISED